MKKLLTQKTLYFFTKIQTMLRLTIQLPKILKRTRISSYNFIRKPKLPGTTPQRPPIPVRNPSLRLPCTLWQAALQTGPISHKGLLLHRCSRIPGRRWKCLGKCPGTEQSKKAGSKMPTSGTKFPLLWQAGKGKGTLVFDHMARWWERRRECVGWCWRGEGEMPQGVTSGWGESRVSGSRNLSWDMRVRHWHPPLPSCVP